MPNVLTCVLGYVRGEKEKNGEKNIDSMIL